MEKSYIIVYQGDIIAALAINNITDYVILNDEIAIIYVEQSFKDATLESIPEVSWWEIDVPLSDMLFATNNPQGQTIRSAIGTDYITNSPYLNVTGEGVIIAILGSGIDYLHPDFMFDDRTTKIVSIWDQEKDTNPPPTGMIFGSEFTREDINNAIDQANFDLTYDNLGKGTIAAGISSGTGRLNSRYMGVATGSELVVVKLRENNGVYLEGAISYRNTDFLCGIRYVLDVARKENKMLIINLAIGESSTNSLLTDYLETFDEISNGGVIVVSAAGNEGNTDIHYQGAFTQLNEINDISIQVGEQKSLEISMVADGPGRIAATIISPSGELSKTAYYSPEYYLYTGRFNLENSSYEMRYKYPSLLTGEEELTINIYNIKPGVWTLRMVSQVFVTGRYDIYLPNRSIISPQTRFLRPNPFGTITHYGTISSVITVGAFNGQIDNLWIGSSKGTFRSSELKPDIVAPGVDLMSTYTNQTYTSATGTGVSSSAVCGVLALIMEYLSRENKITRSELSVEVLKSYLMIGARRQPIYNYPNNQQGYGILDLKNTFSEIARNL